MGGWGGVRQGAVCVCVGGGGGVRQGAVCVWEGKRVVVIGIIRQGGAGSYIDFLYRINNIC